jgi:hypothetical protein
MKTSQKLTACAAAMAAACLSAGNLNAETLTGTYTIAGDPNNLAVNNGNGTYELTSPFITPTTYPYSWVDFALNQTVTFSQLTSLDAVFTANAGGAEGGAPRLVIDLSNGGDVNVLLGTSPDFTDSDASLNTYSGVNLIGNNDSGRYDTSNDGLPGGNPFTTYAGASGQIGLGGLVVTDIAFVLDGGWAGSSQDITLNSIDAAASVPDAWSTMAGSLIACAGLAGLGGLKRFARVS